MRRVPFISRSGESLCRLQPADLLTCPSCFQRQQTGGQPTFSSLEAVSHACCLSRTRVKPTDTDPTVTHNNLRPLPPAILVIRSAVLEKVVEYLEWVHKYMDASEGTRIPDFEKTIPPELALELLITADFLDV